LTSPSHLILLELAGFLDIAEFIKGTGDEVGKIGAAAILVQSSLAFARWNCHAQGRLKEVRHIDCFGMKGICFFGVRKKESGSLSAVNQT
jgi:hypothetical protein